MTDQLTAESCRESLKAVIDPEIYQNIIDLGLVYQIHVSPERAVDVTMTYTTPMCPMGPQIKADVEQTLTKAGATGVNVKVVFQPMWTPHMMTQELQRELGIVDETAEQTSAQVEEEEEWVPPPLREKQQKKGLLSRIFGW